MTFKKKLVFPKEFNKDICLIWKEKNLTNIPPILLNGVLRDASQNRLKMRSSNGVFARDLYRHVRY